MTIRPSTQQSERALGQAQDDSEVLFRNSMRLLLFVMIYVALPSCRDSASEGAGGHPDDESSDLVAVRKWAVPADLMKRLLEGPPSEPEARPEQNDPFAGGCKFYLPLPDLLETYYEIPFPSGTSVDFSPNRGELLVKQTTERIAKIDELLNSLGPMELFVLDRGLFHPIGDLVLNGGDYPSGMATQKWHVAPRVMDELFDSMEIRGQHGDDPFADSTEASQSMQRPVRQRTLPEVLEGGGIAIGDGASVVYDRGSSTVVSVNSESNAFYTEILLLNCAISVSRESGKQNRVPGSD